LTSINKRTKKRKKSEIKGPETYSIDELRKHIDPILFRNLLKIQIDSIKPIRVTVAFWDISGFSNLCNELGIYPNAIAYVLRPYFESAVRIISKYNGVLDKFIGDGILAFFGYDGTHEDRGDPNNAIMAALELKKAFSIHRKDIIKHCKEYYGKDVGNIKLKCGMHNGNPFIHYFNTTERNDVSILGPDVNFASRLEEYAKDDQIIISRDLRHMVQKNFELKEIRLPNKKRIKSFEKEDVIYSVIRKKTGKKGKTRNIRFPKQKLKTNKISKFIIPYKIKIGRETKVFAEFSGSVKAGSLTLCIRDSSGNEQWYPDRKSYDGVSNKGKLFIENGTYSREWYFPTDFVPGPAHATVGVFEDTDIPNVRDPVALKHKKIIIY
jgi:class 3 adenylate cyclase